MSPLGQVFLTTIRYSIQKYSAIITIHFELKIHYSHNPTCVRYAHNHRTSGNMTKAAAASEATPPPPAGSPPPAVPPPHAAARAETPMQILENIANYEDLESASLLSDEDVMEELSDGTELLPASAVLSSGALSGDALSSCSSVPSSCAGSALRRPPKKKKRDR